MNVATIICAAALLVPRIDTDFKAYMDWRCITNTASQQYALQQKAVTDENGLRKVGEYYCVALGSYYGSEIGTCYKVTLDTGESFNAILADQKADCDTDRTHRYHPMKTGGNVVEFVVDVQALPKSARRAGSISAIEGFEGNITSIEVIEGERE